IRTTARSSVEETLKEAKEFGAPVDQARKIHNVVTNLVRTNTSPGLVKSFEVKFAPDSANNRAVWIHLLVDNDLKPSLEKITALNKVASKVRSVLLNEDLDFWPYVDIRGRLDPAPR